MDTVLNLESIDLVENPLPSWPSSNLGSKPGKHNEAVSPTPHMENTSFEFQIHEIDMAINKCDGVIGANQDTTNREVDSHPKTAPRILTLGENYGEIDQETSRLLVVADPTLTSPTITQNNPTSRKWKQLAHQFHLGDSSMQSTVARK